MPDVSAFVETLRSARGFFESGPEVYISRAPGRLDVMGGIADYSGSLVLEMPIAEAALAALQRDASRKLSIMSLGAENGDRDQTFEMPLDDFIRNGAPVSYSDARRIFERNARDRWAAYIAGAFLVLMREVGVVFETGARILIDSKVPEGKGVSSSAAIEVAAMKAIVSAFEIDIDTRQLAILCQKVENLVVGAPCGIMDQMSSAAGDAGCLLSMVCQPAELEEAVEIPDGIAFWGIDSGIRHSVGAGDYGSVRTGAFMGYRIIADAAGLLVSDADNEGVIGIDDPIWQGYLANLTPAEFETDYAARLPVSISGTDFLDRWNGISDTVTNVDRNKNYAVRHPTKHPVYENARVRDFAKLLWEPLTDKSLARLGQLMYDSHGSYSDCGLGTHGTDLLTELVRGSRKLFGARVTGGGSGGTVAILGREDAGQEIERITESYEKQIGYRPYVFSGSSMGASAFGHLRVNF
jgi:galactokinase